MRGSQFGDFVDAHARTNILGAQAAHKNPPLQERLREVGKSRLIVSLAHARVGPTPRAGVHSIPFKFPGSLLSESRRHCRTLQVLVAYLIPCSIDVNWHRFGQEPIELSRRNRCFFHKTENGIRSTRFFSCLVSALASSKTHSDRDTSVDNRRLFQAYREPPTILIPISH